MEYIKVRPSSCCDNPVVPEVLLSEVNIPIWGRHRTSQAICEVVRCLRVLGETGMMDVTFYLLVLAPTKWNPYIVY